MKPKRPRIKSRPIAASSDELKHLSRDRNFVDNYAFLFIAPSGEADAAANHDGNA